MFTSKNSAPLRSRRRGATAVYTAISLPVLGMAAALGVETVYLGVVQLELQGVSDAAAHAATLRLNRTHAGLQAARAEAVSVVDGMRVHGAPYSLDPTDVEFGYWDEDLMAFVVTDNPTDVQAVRVPLSLPDVGLGLGKSFFDQTVTVRTCSAARRGTGNATTGELGGPGLNNGHFDYDTTDPRFECQVATTCEGTTNHTHEFDDVYDVTSSDAFSGVGGQLPVNGCTDAGGNVTDCYEEDASRVIPDVVLPFKIIIVNADLSPGAWITINGEPIDVVEYDDIPFSELETYTLFGGFNPLDQLSVDFDVDVIANCELLPTVTGRVRSNIPGINGEWRSGALTLQLVRADAVLTPGRSAGGHDVVVNQQDGLLWEATHFWHWSGAAYTEATAEDWQADFDELDCGGLPEFVDSVPGGESC